MHLETRSILNVGIHCHKIKMKSSYPDTIGLPCTAVGFSVTLHSETGLQKNNEHYHGLYSSVCTLNNALHKHY